MSERYDILTARKVGDKTFWTRIGVMFPNKQGGGFSLSFEALPIPQMHEGKLEVRAVAFPPKDRDDKPTGQQGASKGRALDDDIPF